MQTVDSSRSAVAPRVTVAMVTYNSEQYVSAAIESVLSQKFEDIELIVSDDASTDRSWQIIQEHRDPRIRAFRNDQNLGEYPNRNRVLEMARGEYLIYIDGDDLLYDHGLETMVRMLDGFPEAGAALARPWTERHAYPRLVSPREIYLHEYLGNSILAINFVHILFRRSVLEAVGGFDCNFRMGDTDSQRRIALGYPCLLVPDGCAWWRRRPGQASARLLVDGTGPFESLLRAQQLMRSPLWPLSPEETRQARRNLYGGVLRLALYSAVSGQPGLALRIVRNAAIPLSAWRWLGVPSRRDYTGGEFVTTGYGRKGEGVHAP